MDNPNYDFTYRMLSAFMTKLFREMQGKPYRFVYVEITLSVNRFFLFDEA